MSRRKRLYRVTAGFSDSWVDEDGVTQVGYTRTWHYQDKRAASRRAELVREGRPASGGYGHNGDSYFEPAIPKAEWVRVEESHPVTWPESS